MSEREYEGGCLCGSTRFRVSGMAANGCYCHCRSCRLAAGASSVAWVTFPTDRFRILHGKLAIYASSENVERGFCASCGTSITYAHADRPGEIDVSLAVLDDPGTLRPEYHIWVSHKPSWVLLGDGLPQYPEWKKSTA